MKKIILVITLVCTSLLQGMETEKKNITVKGKICVEPFSPIYAGKCKVDFEGNKDIKDLLNDPSIKPSDALQEVWAWNGSDTSTRFSHNPYSIVPPVSKGTINPEKGGRFFPACLPYNRLKGLKEGDTLSITIDGIPYELTADQKNGPYPNQVGNTFEKALVNMKAEFDKEPNYFKGDKEYLLEKGILWKSWWGTTTHQSTKYKFYSILGLSFLTGGVTYYNPGSIIDSFKGFVGNWWSKAIGN